MIENCFVCSSKGEGVKWYELYYIMLALGFKKIACCGFSNNDNPTIHGAKEMKKKKTKMLKMAKFE